MLTILAVYLALVAGLLYLIHTASTDFDEDA